MYDVKAKRKVDVKDPKRITKRTKRGRLITMLQGVSPLTGIKVFRIVGNQAA